MSLEEKKTKKLSLDNFGKFLSSSAKNTRKKKSLSSSMSTLSDSVLSRNSTIQSTSTISFQDSYSPPSISSSESPQVTSIKHQIQLKRQALAELDEEHKHYSYQNQQLQEQLDWLLQKSEKRAQELEIQRNKYNHHLSSLRCTTDDPTSISNRLVSLRQHITAASKVLLPHIAETGIAERFKSLWLNLSDPIDKLDLSNTEFIQMLTEKFMMDVLVQNMNIIYFPGWNDDNNTFFTLQNWLDENTGSEFYSTRLRQEMASIAIQKDLEQPIKRNWQHLYRGLQRVYPILKEKEERNQLLSLVKEAVMLGLAMKGQENRITAIDVKEGTQALDPVLMNEVQGKSSGIVTFCISPPFVIKMEDSRYHTLLKGLVFC